MGLKNNTIHKGLSTEALEDFMKLFTEKEGGKSTLSTK